MGFFTDEITEKLRFYGRHREKCVLYGSPIYHLIVACFPLLRHLPASLADVVHEWNFSHHFDQHRMEEALEGASKRTNDHLRRYDSHFLGNNSVAAKRDFGCTIQYTSTHLND
uniref:Uncharacterized protein n=1 Tax=Schistocephalus solidus TaxID=70667 RepID=A0A0X3NN59_SCHSO